MTIRQLELYSGVSNSYLSQIENGNRGIPSPEIIKKLSKGLKIDYEDMMIKAGYFEDKNKDDTDEEFEEFIKDVRRWYKEAPKDREEDLQRLRRIFEAYKND